MGDALSRLTSVFIKSCRFCLLIMWFRISLQQIYLRIGLHAGCQSSSKLILIFTVMSSCYLCVVWAACSFPGQSSCHGNIPGWGKMELDFCGFCQYFFTLSICVSVTLSFCSSRGCFTTLDSKLNLSLSWT